jgi:hypothetical protein
MPVKRDHLSTRIALAFQAMERRLMSGWASQSQCFDAGWRAGYEQGRIDAYAEDNANLQVLMAQRSEPDHLP